jgi:hypothetical protein
MVVRYLLQLEEVHNHDRDGETDHETVASFEMLDDAVAAMHAYLEDEYGPDLEDVFESVVTQRDAAFCGGVQVEAVGLEGDVMRLWIQEVPDRPRACRARAAPRTRTDEES